MWPWFGLVSMGVAIVLEFLAFGVTYVFSLGVVVGPGCGLFVVDIESPYVDIAAPFVLLLTLVNSLVSFLGGLGSG